MRDVTAQSTATDIAFTEGWERLDMAIATKPSLVERVKDLRPKTWLEKLPAKQQAELIELRRAWQAGEVAAGPMKVHQEVVAYLESEAVSETQLRRFLGRKPKEVA